jgi:hypothetical protein
MTPRFALHNPVWPGELDSANRFLVPNGSTIAEPHADALIAALESEHGFHRLQHRCRPDVWIIDSLMKLAVGAPVAVDSISA